MHEWLSKEVILSINEKIEHATAIRQTWNFKSCTRLKPLIE